METDKEKLHRCLKINVEVREDSGSVEGHRPCSVGWKPLTQFTCNFSVCLCVWVCVRARARVNYPTVSKVKQKQSHYSP